jgi:hypothetical protein
MESLFCFVVKEAPGTEGEGSEVWRMTRTNFKLGTGLGYLNKLAANKMAEVIVAPLEKLKLDIERLLKEYKPPEHKEVEELELTWKGGLWRMALEAAMGVQYLHHHRYEQRTERERRAKSEEFTCERASERVTREQQRTERERRAKSEELTCERATRESSDVQGASEERRATTPLTPPSCERATRESSNVQSARRAATPLTPPSCSLCPQVLERWGDAAQRGDQRGGGGGGGVEGACERRECGDAPG